MPREEVPGGQFEIEEALLARYPVAMKADTDTGNRTDNCTIQYGD
eukprot:CAMPEP_0194126548 /NCGR_PEP_ID=MMETSP0150-20130528/60049_1 /TAXON_ID=122233 /ORGANISM="Chaetoceros debilis, Strain MM31A-1" /LENGTH=44 /DNA_ID= /DNA_START= /DNA_END= /DNA_ORIENTATION=